ncbi:tyrosine-type recombinase/integrase [uncultured Desulfosarcina sp.]|uniref:tyrosine-type recombinase/integrase n=1 Tax=uncultured Desulfosarcina sp. TaxID=218289 RepID=UPI0029C66065|nr:tyrosine-type recombinase/integrase [uncultured Desulfosarcina sp.]
MPKSNKGVFVSERNGIKWWRYDFSENCERHRGWIHPVHGMTKRTANAELKRIIADVIVNKTPTGIRRQKPNTKRIIADYLKYLEQYHPSTYASVKYYKRYFRYFYGKQIDEKAIEEYRASRRSTTTSRGTPTSHSTINRELQYLRAAFNHAGIKPNPFDKFKKNREVERVRYLNRDEMAALLDAANKSQNSYLRTIIEVAILTGMRKMEILKLHRDNVDFDLDTIFVPSSIDKTHKNKTIPIPKPLKTKLMALAARSEWISPELVDTELSRKGEIFVFLRRCIIKHRVTSFSIVEDFDIVK